jgi:dephospho-CoA kinase
VTRLFVLTGSVASGKSSAAALFRDWGAGVIDADRLVHGLQQAGQPVFEAMVREFGDGIVAPSGQLDRAEMRRRMLADAGVRERLERIVHPAVATRQLELVARARAQGTATVVLEIPLYFEIGAPGHCDGVVVVAAPVEARRARLMRDRQLSADQADALIATQLPADVKRAQANWVIDNDGDLAQLALAARAVWDAMQA